METCDEDRWGQVGTRARHLSQYTKIPLPQGILKEDETNARETGRQRRNV